LVLDGCQRLLQLGFDAVEVTTMKADWTEQQDADGA
jgi:hypothetical protein